MLKRTKIVLAGVPVVTVVVLGAAAYLFATGGPDPAQFEYLKEAQVPRFR
jgi:hypothetical protein